jgi:hypothetical protein
MPGAQDSLSGSTIGHGRRQAKRGNVEIGTRRRDDGALSERTRLARTYTRRLTKPPLEFETGPDQLRSARLAREAPVARWRQCSAEMGG